MSAAIETMNLVKRFGAVTAVDGLSLRVDRGEIYAFLGLNGAGKTTTIRMLLGMIKPTSGEVVVLGGHIGRQNQALWSAVGYLVESVAAYPELTVRENLEAVRRLRPGVAAAAVDAAIDRLQLGVYADRRAGTLSLGNAQRLGIAKALLHHPKLLILDEPANGLDPAGIVEMRHLLLELTGKQGTTIFMASHILSEVSRLAQRIGIIHEGRLIQEMDSTELEQRQRRRLVVRARDGDTAAAVLRQAGYQAELAADGEISLQDEGALARPDDVATVLVQAGQAPLLLVIQQEDLEQYFLRLTGPPAPASDPSEHSG